MPRQRSSQSTLNVQFPAAGLSEERAIRETPPFATPDCLNVRPENIFNRRRMGGSRPGVAKFFDQDLGAEIRCVKPLTYVKEGDTRTFYNDPFDTYQYPSDDDWTAESWITNGTLTTENGFAQGSPTGGLMKGCVLRDVLSAATSLTEYTVEALIAPFRDLTSANGQIKTCVYTMWLRMNNATPVGTTDGVKVELAVYGRPFNPNFSVYVYKYVSGVRTLIGFMSGVLGYAISGSSWAWFRCKISTNTLNVFYGSSTPLTFTIPGGSPGANITMPTAAGRRVALSISKDASTSYTGPGRVDTFRIRYAGTPDRERTIAFAVCSGHVWRETEIGVMEQSASSVTLTSGRVQAAEYLQKMYIADYALKVNKRTQYIGLQSWSTYFDTTHYNITDFSVTSNMATITTDSGTNGLFVGQYISILEILDSGVNVPQLTGDFKLLSKSSTQFTFEVNTPNLTATSASGTAIVRGVVINDSTLSAGVNADEDLLEYQFLNADGVQLGGGTTPLDGTNGANTYLKHPILSVPDGSILINYWLWRAPKVYDPLADTLTLWQADSMVPESFNVVGVQATNGTITITTEPAHKFQKGQRVLLSINPPTGTNKTGTDNIVNQEINGVYTVMTTDPIESAPTTFTIEKSIGDDTHDDIGKRSAKLGFKKKITVAGATDPNKVQIKTTRKHDFVANDYVTCLSSTADTSIDGTFQIKTVTGNFLLEAWAPANTFAATDAAFKNWSGDVYTAKGTAKLADYQSKGYVPPGCQLVSQWRGRMVMSRGNTVNYARIDDPYDWDYGQTDESAAVASTLTDGGVIGQPVTAHCPVDEDTIIFGCRNELWRQTGDPAAGGKLYNVSRKVGIIDANAWTITPDGLLVFLSEDGIYSYSVKSPSQIPVPVTAKPLPAKLRNIATASVTVSMSFDTLNKGVWLFCTFDSGATTHWFLDWQDKGLWPIRFGDTSFDPLSCVAFNGRDPSEAGVLLGCRDGYLRMFRDGQGTDDGTPFNCYLVFGPIRPAGNQTNAGTIMEMTVNPVQDYALCNTITVDLYPGYNHQEALVREKTGTAMFSATFDAVQPLTDSTRPMITEGSFAIKVSSNVQVFPWGLEALTMLVQDDGPNYRRG